MTAPDRPVAGRWVLAVCLTLTLLQSASYWAVSKLVNPAEGWVPLALYRYTDITYLPLIRALSRGQLGESVILERLGEGVVSFPIASMTPHALGMAAFGDAGLMVADIGVAGLTFAAAMFLFRSLGLRPASAAVAAGLIGTMGVQLLIDGVARRFGGAGPCWWDHRIPRTYVTIIPILAGLAFLVRLVRAGAPGRRGDWLGLAAATAILVQGDIHTAFLFGLLGGGVAAGWLVRGPNRETLAASLGIAAGVAAVLLVPFAYQRWHELPDVPRRFGVFAVDRLHPPFAVSGGMTLSLAFGLAGAAAGWAVTRDTDRRRGFALLGAAVVVAFVALPVWCVTLGQTIQVYHFPQRLAIVASYAALAGLLAVVEAWSPDSRRLAVALVAGCALSLGLACRWHAARAKYTGHPIHAYDGDAGYRQSLGGLTNELATDRYARCQVLATFDPLPGLYWTGLRDGYGYVPDAFVTAVSDEVLEERFLRLCKLLRISADKFETDVLTDNELFSIFSLMKYQAGRSFSFAPPDEYEPADAARIRTGVLYNGEWELAVPRSERQRLAARYAAVPGEPAGALDVIVMRTVAVAKGWKPPADKFGVTFRNGHFVVWVRHGL